MRPLSVVVSVLPKHSTEMASAHDEQPVEAFVSNRLNPKLCERVGRGDRTGVLITLIPSERNTSSKLAVNLASRSGSRT